MSKQDRQGVRTAAELERKYLDSLAGGGGGGSSMREQLNKLNQMVAQFIANTTGRLEELEQKVEPLMEYTITYLVAGEVYETVTVQGGTEVAAPEEPKSETGTFVEWQAEGKAVAFPFVPKKDMELTAVFE